MNIQQKQIEVRKLLDQIKRQAIKDCESNPEDREPSAAVRALTEELKALMKTDHNDYDGSKRLAYENKVISERPVLEIVSPNMQFYRDLFTKKDAHLTQEQKDFFNEQEKIWLGETK